RLLGLFRLRRVVTAGRALPALPPFDALPVVVTGVFGLIGDLHGGGGLGGTVRFGRHNGRATRLWWAGGAGGTASAGAGRRFVPPAGTGVLAGSGRAGFGLGHSRL